MGSGSRGWAAVAGVVAAGVALAVTEVVSVVVAARRPSLLGALAGRLVHPLAGPLRDVAVRWFGTGDKAALVAGIVAACLALGALVGLAARRRPVVAPLAFGGAAIAGYLVARRDALASAPVLGAAALLGAAAGSALLLGLLELLRAGDRAEPASGTDGPGPRHPLLDDPAVRTPDRRAFLTAAGVAGLGAVTLAASGPRARSLRAGRPAAATTGLPVPARRIAVPAGTAVGSAGSTAAATPGPDPAGPDLAGPDLAGPDLAGLDLAGLTPWLTPNDRHYRIDTAIFVPQIDPARWSLTVDGMVDRPLRLSYDDLLRRDLVETPITMACVSNDVGGSLIGNAVWLGAPLADLLEEAGVQPGATQVVGRSVDDFIAGFPTEHALDGRLAMVAVGMNGVPLPAVHGFPARLVVPGLYGYVSATKWLSRIELTTMEAVDGYWVTLDWAKEAPILTQSRIDVPRPGTTAAPGPMAIAGVAWAPHRGVRAVEVRIDDGPWVPAELGAAASGDTWVQWVRVWEATPGHHVASVRAVDGTGAIQIEEPSYAKPRGASGYHYRGFQVAER